MKLLSLFLVFCLILGTFSYPNSKNSDISVGKMHEMSEKPHIRQRRWYGGYGYPGYGWGGGWRRGWGGWGYRPFYGGFGGFGGFGSPFGFWG